MQHISRVVWVLSLVSMFTDMASEMLYPIMPIYLKHIGFSVLLIGILEGFAEATAGLSKGYFGKQSDVWGRRVPFVQVGYALSTLSKPLLAIFTFPIWVFGCRAIDRLGKGIRTGARDALLAQECTPETKGKVFGFHRSVDTFGAVLGPALALLYLHFYPQNYQTLFLLATLPGLLAVLVSLRLREKSAQESIKLKKSVSFWTSFSYWPQSPILYRKLAIGLLVFAVFNSSDVFLLLKAKETGLNDTEVIGLYIFYNLIYALLAYPMGILADKLGLKKIFIMGLVIFAVVYFGMALNTNYYLFFGLWFLYGLYGAATEGLSKAWLSSLVPKTETATAIGTYAGFQSLCTLLASSLAGVLWYWGGAELTFITTGVMSVLIVLYLSTLPKP
ncbi:MAG: MFS transporter [Cytophagales bacterium]|nr:MAG: MFS transporter [Cytophagales bacterium]TAF60180.1 MAG: MFS transporter [Cytophagales bacterium]